MDRGYVSWTKLFQRRLVTAFLVADEQVATIDFDQAMDVARQMPTQITYTWIKTMSNAWCTSSRMHEPLRYSCLFGCVDACDEARHYFTCPVLLALACDAIRLPTADPIRSAPHILHTLGVRPVNASAFYIVYIMFCLYHDRKSHIYSYNNTVTEALQSDAPYNREQASR